MFHIAQLYCNRFQNDGPNEEFAHFKWESNEMDVVTCRPCLYIGGQKKRWMMLVGVILLDFVYFTRANDDAFIIQIFVFAVNSVQWNNCSEPSDIFCEFVCCVYGYVYCGCGMWNAVLIKTYFPPLLYRSHLTPHSLPSLSLFLLLSSASHLVSSAIDSHIAHKFSYMKFEYVMWEMR